MNKKKVLKILLILLFVSIIGLMGGLFLSGKFRPDMLKQNQEEKSNDISVNDKAYDKADIPSAPISLIIDNVEILNEECYKNISEYGFNTLIFETDVNNFETIIDILNNSNNLFYNGIIADVSEDYRYIETIIEKCNLNFIILSGIDETLTNYEDSIKECVSFVREKDPLINIGIQPMFISKLEPSLKKLISLSYFDFVFLSESNIASESVKTAQDIWMDAETDLWLNFNLIGLNEIDGEKAESIINSISSCKNLLNCKALSFNNLSSVLSSDGNIANNVLEFIKDSESNILDRKFAVSNFKSNEFNVNESIVTFKGTSNPLYPLTCNNETVKTADNGDFSFDCRLVPGVNTVTFSHRNESYVYKVNYIVKILKNVDPISSVTVPGNMNVEVKAIALKKSTVKVAFNGKTYDMNIQENEESEDSNNGSDFATFSALLSTCKETEGVQNLGSYKVTATYGGLKETLTGATVYVKAKYIPPTTTQEETTISEQITETQRSTESSNKPTTSTTSPGKTTRRSYKDMTASVKYTRATTTSRVSKTTKSNAEVNTVVNNNGLLQKHSYKKNYGLGTSKICEIIDDYVETFPGNSTSTFSLPNYTPLLKGTVDYVENSAEFDNTTYYILSSGVKVPVSRKENSAAGQDTKYKHVNVVDGYIMPMNTMHVLSCTSYNGETIVKIDMNRKVPFNVKLLGQTYSSYNGRSVKVSKPDFTGLEFTFYESDRIYGTDLSFMNSVIKSGRYYCNDDKVIMSFSFDTSGKFYGFHYEYDNNDILVITIRNKPEFFSDCVIMLDPGHGGYDPGAVCCVTSNSFASEKKITLALALKVKELLEAEGATVLLTRSDDRFIGLTDRVEKMRLRNPDIFVSLHCDSSSSSSAWGATSYYYRAFSQPLATSIQQSIVKAYKNKIYHNDKVYADGSDRGSNFYAYRVIRIEECPAVLIEYGFVSNTTECQKLQNASVRNILAQATVDGIKNYYQNS